MAAGWENAAASMLDTCLSVFGNENTYLRDGVTTPIPSAVWDDNYLSLDPQTGVQVMSTSPTLGMRISDMPSGAFLEGDQIIHNGITYNIVDNQPDTENHTLLILQRATL
jgi:hypothetical protein